MNKAILLTSVCLLHFFWGVSQVQQVDENKKDSTYLIERIDSINNWYLIYAKKLDTNFKIISSKDVRQMAPGKKIMVGRYYRLILISRKNDDVPTIKGIKIKPMNSLDVHCYVYDEQTSICIEQEKKIFDLHRSPNIIGLTYIE